MYAFGVKRRLIFWTPTASFIDPRRSKIKLCSTRNPGRKSLAQTQFLGHWPLTHWNLYVFHKSLNVLFWLICYPDVSHSHLETINMPGPGRRGAEKEMTMLPTEPHQVQLSNNGKEGKLSQQGNWNARRTPLRAECSAILCTSHHLIILHCSWVKADVIKIINQPCVSVELGVFIKGATLSKMKALVKSWNFSMFSSRYQHSGFGDVDLSVQTPDLRNWRQITRQHPYLSQEALQPWASGRNEIVIWWSISLL